jgi:hypothetical protein
MACCAVCPCCQVCAWLARLGNKLDAAQSLETELRAPRSADGSCKSSSGSGRRLPLCKDCLCAAETARRAVQSMGLQGLEAAPAAQLAQGHGRAVCWLLQGMADIVWGQLQLSCRRPSHSTAHEAQQCEELLPDDTEDEADIAAAAAAIAAAAADFSEDLDDIGFAAMAGDQQQEGQHGSPGGRHAGSAATGHNAVIRTQVRAAMSCHLRYAMHVSVGVRSTVHVVLGGLQLQLLVRPCPMHIVTRHIVCSTSKQAATQRITLRCSAV